MPPKYTYRAQWDPEHGEYQAVCLEFPGYSGWALTAREAVAELEHIVEERVAEMTECGQRYPDSLGDHRYSGRFLVRTSRALHARLTVEAAEQRVSLNQWVAAKLTDRPVAFNLNDLFD